MPQTRDIGPWYFHFIRYPEPLVGAALWGRATTDEVEAPYRAGKGVVLRFGPRLAFVAGKWRHTGRTEEEALLAALGASPLAAGRDEEDDVVVAGTKLRRWGNASMGQAQQDAGTGDAGRSGEADSTPSDG